MSLFKLKKDNKGSLISVIRIEPLSFRNENREMHPIFNLFLKQFFNIGFITSRFPVKSKLTIFSPKSRRDYEIDALGLNENNNPVIIEYGRKNKTVSQTLGYYNNFNENHRSEFEKIVKAKLGGAQKVNWSKIIVLIIAKAIQKGEFETIEFLKATKKDFDFHFFSYQYFGYFLTLDEKKLEKGLVDEGVYKIVNGYEGDKEILLKLHYEIMGMGFPMQCFKNRLRYFNPVDASPIFEVRIDAHRISIKPLKKKFKRIGSRDITKLSFGEMISEVKRYRITET